MLSRFPPAFRAARTRSEDGSWHGTMRHDLISGVEEILERTVVAFLSDNHIAPDIAVEVFVLARSEHGRPADDGVGSGALGEDGARHAAGSAA
jgi:hypothetical protein